MLRRGVLALLQFVALAGALSLSGAQQAVHNKTCLLFVGPHKTGSTTLEKQLHNLSTRKGLLLHELGYEWLTVKGYRDSTKAHAHLPRVLRDVRDMQHPRITTAEALANITLVRATDQALASVKKHLVIASEAWCFADASSLQVLGDLLARHGFNDVRVVINWRPYAQRTLSFYQELRHQELQIHRTEGFVYRHPSAVAEDRHVRCVNDLIGERLCNKAFAPSSFSLDKLFGCPLCYTDTTLDLVQRFIAEFGRTAVHVVDLPGAAVAGKSTLDITLEEVLRVAPEMITARTVPSATKKMWLNPSHLPSTKLHSLRGPEERTTDLAAIFYIWWQIQENGVDRGEDEERRVMQCVTNDQADWPEVPMKCYDLYHSALLGLAYSDIKLRQEYPDLVLSGDETAWQGPEPHHPELCAVDTLAVLMSPVWLSEFSARLSRCT